MSSLSGKTIISESMLSLPAVPAGSVAFVSLSALSTIQEFPCANLASKDGVPRAAVTAGDLVLNFVPYELIIGEGSAHEVLDEGALYGEARVHAGSQNLAGVRSVTDQRDTYPYRAWAGECLPESRFSSRRSDSHASQGLWAG